VASSPGSSPPLPIPAVYQVAPAVSLQGLRPAISDDMKAESSIIENGVSPHYGRLG
jgi:hypothetical protein